MALLFLRRENREGAGKSHCGTMMIAAGKILRTFWGRFPVAEQHLKAWGDEVKL